MSDPQRWQLGHQTYPSLPYANQPQQSQQSAYRHELTMYDPSLQQQPQQPQQPQPQHHHQQPLPLPPLRPLQPSPYPAAAGYPVYPYPRNNAKPVSTEESESDKAENRRTRISRAWYNLTLMQFFFFLFILLLLLLAMRVEEKK